MRKTLRYTTGLFAIFMASTLFFSCEGGTTFTKIVANYSSDTIVLRLNQSKILSSDTFTISPNELKTVFVLDIERGFADDTYQCTSEIDSVSISTTANKIVKKDFMDSDNWDRQSENGRNAQEICIFTLTDSDFN